MLVRFKVGFVKLLIFGHELEQNCGKPGRSMSVKPSCGDTQLLARTAMVSREVTWKIVFRKTSSSSSQRYLILMRMVTVLVIWIRGYVSNF